MEVTLNKVGVLVGIVAGTAATLALIIGAVAYVADLGSGVAAIKVGQDTLIRKLDNSEAYWRETITAINSRTDNVNGRVDAANERVDAIHLSYYAAVADDQD